MKFAAIAAATALTLAACAGTEAEAVELGGGLSVGAELDNKYNVDDEKFTMTLSPEVGYSAWGADFTVGTDLNLYNGDEFGLNEDKAPTVDFGVEYGIGLWGLTSTAYAETGWNFETEKQSAVELGLKFAF
jgi:hypothetical protein